MPGEWGAGRSPWAPHSPTLPPLHTSYCGCYLPACPWTSPSTLLTRANLTGGRCSAAQVTKGSGTDWQGLGEGAVTGQGTPRPFPGISGPSHSFGSSMTWGRSVDTGLTPWGLCPVRVVGPGSAGSGRQTWNEISARPLLSCVFLSEVLRPLSLPVFEQHHWTHN